MSRWSALAIVLAFAGALVFRLPKLETRPLHNDEAVNAIKVTELWQQGRYRYDPDEYHGPTLHYATLPFLWLSGANDANELKDRTLRLPTVAFGAALVLLLFLFAGGLCSQALAWSALFMVISPAMVFYSRYFIHEMLLVFFTALALGSAWRYTRSPSRVWAIITGAAVGLMFATKETFVITLAAATAAGIGTAWWIWREERGRLRAQPGLSVDGLRESGRPFPKDVAAALRAALPSSRDIALATAAGFVVWLLFFSSFFTNWAGLLDSVRTYFPWLKRAAGHSPHLHPWYFYFQRLGWFHPVKGPVFSELLILLLAGIAGVSAFRRKESSLLVFLTLYTAALAAAYSVITYKTPWCLLNFYYGAILLAGAGAAGLIDELRSRPLRVAGVAVLLAASTQLAVQSWRASYAFASDRRNPYVYAQTVPDVLNLVQRAEGLARSSPSGFETVVKVIAPENEYWPLPWYLRRFKNIGWFERLPEDPFAPMIIVSSKLDARFDDKSERKWIMAGLTELRPGNFFELYVELELWKKYVQSLPREPDSE